MKNLINIGGGLLLVWFLLRKKEVQPEIIDDILPEILVPDVEPAPAPEPSTERLVNGNHGISPTATTNVVSDLDALRYAIQGLNFAPALPPAVPVTGGGQSSGK